VEILSGASKRTRITVSRQLFLKVLELGAWPLWNIMVIKKLTANDTTKTLGFLGPALFTRWEKK
jgi:hypothetical protein